MLDTGFCETLSPSDAALLPKIVERLRADLGDDLLGVIAGGSRLRGEGDVNSDIDVVAIIASPRRRRWNFVIDDVEIETFINPMFQMHRYFVNERKDGRGIMPHLVGTGRILFDPQGLLPEVQREALAVREMGPLPPSAFEVWQMRYFAADALHDIADVVEREPAAASLLIGELLPKLIANHYWLSGRWRVKGKRVLPDLATWDGEAVRLVAAAMDCGSAAAARLASLEALAVHVLRPVGGPIGLEWQLAWEALVP